MNLKQQIRLTFKLINYFTSLCYSLVPRDIREIENGELLPLTFRTTQKKTFLDVFQDIFNSLLMGMYCTFGEGNGWGYTYCLYGHIMGKHDGSFGMVNLCPLADLD